MGRTRDVSKILTANTSLLSLASASATYATQANFSATAWTSYTPIYTNLTVGNGSSNARYKQFGKTVFLKHNFSFGSTSSISGNVTLTLPITADTNATMPITMVGLTDADGSYSIGHAWLNSSTTMQIWGIQSTGGNGTRLAWSGLSSTFPHTWATSDQINFFFVYEAA
jgi:hypothetical protein